jgi:hypothetical protein
VIFAREVSDGLASLVKKIDEATTHNKDCRMGSFAVFLNDDESLEKRLKEFADKEKLEKLVLTIDNPAGPKAYKIAKEADITVLLYSKGEVKANYAFRKGEMKDEDVQKIVADLSKILPEQK